jgi:hypothetical protein
MRLRKIGMIEVVFFPPRHPEAFHDPPRSAIGGHGERDDFLQEEILERAVESRAGRFGRVAPTPMLVSQPPSDLNAWREMGFEPGHVQPDQSNEFSHSGHFHGPHPEPMSLQVLADPAGKRIALGAVEHFRKIRHDARVGIESRERWQIIASPLSEDQSFCA